MTVLCGTTFLHIIVNGASKTETELHDDKKEGYIGKNAMQHDVGINKAFC